MELNLNPYCELQRKKRKKRNLQETEIIYNNYNKNRKYSTTKKALFSFSLKGNVPYCNIVLTVLYILIQDRKPVNADFISILLVLITFIEQ